MNYEFRARKQTTVTQGVAKYRTWRSNPVANNEASKMLLLYLLCHLHYMPNVDRRLFGTEEKLFGKQNVSSWVMAT